MGTFAENLWTVMRARGLTRLRAGEEKPMVRELERQTGLPASSLARYLTPRSESPQPSAEAVEKLAASLGTTSRFLVTGTGPMDVSGVEPEVAAPALDVFGVGERRFREWVSEREPQHAEKVPEFLRLLAERRFERWSAKVSALDIEEDLIKEFRAWRRGEWDEEPEGIPYVPAKRQR